MSRSRSIAVAPANHPESGRNRDWSRAIGREADQLSVRRQVGAMMGSLKTVGTVTVALACAAVVGCGGEPGDMADEDVSARTSPLSATSTYVDESQTVTVTVTVCDWSAVAAHPQTTCSVPSGMVLIGGGAEVEGSAPGGGMLIYSLPATKTMWMAGSKDQVTPYPHRIRAYAVGLALAGMDQGSVANLVTITRAKSGESRQPTVTATIPAGHVMLSGGGAVSSANNGAGLLLTESYPSSRTQWTVSGKDHQIPDSGVADVAVISIPSCLNGQGAGECVFSTFTTAQTTVSTGYGTATAITPSGWVPAGAGARATWSTYGRLLTDVFPTNTTGGPGATAFSKDHNFAEGGNTNAFAMSIKGTIPMNLPPPH
jgi:hypothetical protein